MSTAAVAEAPSAKIARFAGLGFIRQQGLLVGIAATVSTLFRLFGRPASVVPTLLFTLVVGNIVGVIMAAILPWILRRSGYLGWLLYFSILLPVGALGSLLATYITIALGYVQLSDQVPFLLMNLRFGTLITLVSGASRYSVASTKARLERQNELLRNQVDLGTLQLNAQQADLKTAHEIQAHLLPRELPSLPGMELACAWQPALSVGGDYFDAFLLDDRRVAIAMADVSGKGISAALLMANIQAAFRAFAPQSEGPAALCARLNQALCGNIAAGKFITFFYGEYDATTRMLRYENAGHSQPMLLRGDRSFALEGGGMVLGLFASAVYEDRSIRLEPGDCLLLTTDGVTEAADAAEDEYGEDRLVTSARAVRGEGAHAIRTRVLEDVTKHCAGNFHDDASLMVLTVGA